MIHPLFLIGLAGLALSACAGKPIIPDAADASRAFVVERELAGRTIGKGVFKSIVGAERGFTAYLDGTWDGETLTLVEDFNYDDGEKDRKTWRLTKLADGTFSGTREDVVGEAKGYFDGPAFRLDYLVDLPKDKDDPSAGARRVGFRDVLILREDGSVFNKASVGWRGIRVGGVELVIERAE